MAYYSINSSASGQFFYAPEKGQIFDFFVQFIVYPTSAAGNDKKKQFCQIEYYTYT